MNSETKYGRVKNLAWQIIDGSTLILEPQNRKAHELNEVGSFIWQEIESVKSSSELAKKLVEEFEIEESIALSDVDFFLQDLCEKKLIEVISS